MLSDRDIRHRILNGSLSIDPISNLNVQVQPASFDVRLGNEFLVFNTSQVSVIDPEDQASFSNITSSVIVEDNGRFILHPGEFVLGTTIERIEVPPDLSCKVEGRSSLGRVGIVIHLTAGFLDPGFIGNTTLEIKNLGPVAVALRPGMRICQFTFTELTSPSVMPYGSDRGSKYQGQTAPTASRLYQDRS